MVGQADGEQSHAEADPRDGRVLVAQAGVVTNTSIAGHIDGVVSSFYVCHSAKASNLFGSNWYCVTQKLP